MRSPAVHRLLAAAAVASLSLAVAACGSDSGGSGGSDGSATPAADVVMTATDGLRWDPEEVSATAGDVSVELRNRSSVQHNLYIIAADGTQLPEHLESTGGGDDETETVDLTAGTYTIICKIPGHSSMKATLTVT